LAFLQSYGNDHLAQQQLWRAIGAEFEPNFRPRAYNATVTRGYDFHDVAGELITEKGIGNGISMIIFTGIVAGIPTHFGRMLGTFEAGDNTKMFPFYFVRGHGHSDVDLCGACHPRAQARISRITYATRATGGKGQKSSLPIRVNQARHDPDQSSPSPWSHSPRFWLSFSALPVPRL